MNALDTFKTDCLHDSAAVDAAERQCHRQRSAEPMWDLLASGDLRTPYGTDITTRAGLKLENRYPEGW